MLNCLNAKLDVQHIYIIVWPCVIQLPRTAIYLALCCMPCGLFLLGPDCSSWTLISRGTSRRSIANPWGNMTLDWITGSNLMISRSIQLQLGYGRVVQYESRLTWSKYVSGDSGTIIINHLHGQFHLACCFELHPPMPKDLLVQPSPAHT